MMVLGVIGDGRVASSLSPRMHNAVLEELGLEGVYLALVVEPAQVEKALAGIRAMGMNGLNVTVPHKQTVIPYLHGLSDQARRLGAVNTIERREDELWGHNTDVEGFRLALHEADYDARDKEALVLGAGGAARALVLALHQEGAARVWVAARRLEQAALLCKQLGGQALPLDRASAIATQVQLIVNATSVSQARDAKNLEATVKGLAFAHNLKLVQDINYGHRENIWARMARSRRVSFQDGLSMLAHQARLSFKIWTGHDLPSSNFLTPLLEVK